MTHPARAASGLLRRRSRTAGRALVSLAAVSSVGLAGVIAANTDSPAQADPATRGATTPSAQQAAARAASRRAAAEQAAAQRAARLAARTADRRSVAKAARRAAAAAARARAAARRAAAVTQPSSPAPQATTTGS